MDEESPQLSTFELNNGKYPSAQCKLQYLCITGSSQQQATQYALQNPEPKVVTSRRGFTRREKRTLVTGEVASDGITTKTNIRHLPDGGLEWDNGGTWSKS